MNRYQSANSTLSFAVLAASVAGMSKWISDNPSAEDPLRLFYGHLSTLALWIFIIALKIKIWIDDHHHFGEAVQEKLPIRIFGFVLAVFSMIFFGLAGYQISAPRDSAELLFVAILISTAWIAVHLVEITVDKVRRMTEVKTSLMREKWVFINVVYCLLLAGFIGWFMPIVPPENLLCILLMFVVLVFDWATSRQTQPP